MSKPVLLAADGKPLDVDAINSRFASSMNSVGQGGDQVPAAGGRYHPGWWGTWVLDLDGPALWNDAAECVVGIDDFTRSPRVLDTVLQVWTHDCDGRLVHGFIGALRDIIGPQANLCSWGEGKRLSKAAVRRMCAEAAAFPDLIAAGRIGKCPV